MAGMVAVMGKNWVVALVVMGDSGESQGLVSSGMGIEMIGGVIVKPDRLESPTWPRKGGGSNSFSGSSAAFSTYWRGGT